MSAMLDDHTREALLTTACQARQVAYAPYSRYRVGAAVLADDGHVYSGANVENAAYPSGMCAERTAVFKAITSGARRILAVAVCTENGGSPCGACRQVLSEFAEDIPIWLSDTQGHVRQSSLYTLLPDHFGPAYLKDGR